MISGPGLYIRKIILSILLFSGITFSLYPQGTSIGGVINEYMDVVAIGLPDNVTVSNSNIFHNGDTVLLIQMKGVVMLGYEAAEYGTWQYNLGTPGGYEFLIIQSINNLTGNIIFTRDILNSYNVAGSVQLIKVHSYNSARVTSELTCQPWDSVTTKTGGVLAMIVGGTLTLEANINVSGKGLTGGTPFTGDGLCISTNSALYNKYAYPVSYTNSGYKGESLVSRSWLSGADIPSVYPGFAKGKGANFTGGGGGNGKYSGGGGGAGITGGGKGGRESSTCGPPEDGGLGGKQVFNTVLEGNLLLGGGGGSSTSEAGSNASPGGKGGGIIIIICDTLKTNGINTIEASGESATPSIGNAGAGGGGGGGTMALYQQGISLQTVSSKLQIYVKGGNGGNAITNNGEGGGGGGGLIFTNLTSFPVNVETSSAGGLRGTRYTPLTNRYSEDGQVGMELPTFNPLLNGFLFNTIRSSVSSNHIDSVCSNMRPPKIIGTRPVGGTGPYITTWEKSYESTFTSPVTLTNDTDPVNYTPSLADAITPTDTVWFRRIIRDSGFPQITDVSKAVKIIVHKGISNNTIGNPDTFCETGNPPPVSQVLPDLIIPTTQYLFYTWQDSANSSEKWSNIPGAVNITNPEYQPPVLTATTSYRRIVVSGSCIDTSLAVKMTILPIITGNKIFSPAEDSICFGAGFQTIKGTTETGTTPVLAGGTNTFIYKWESSINFAPWIAATGISDRDSLNPVELLVESIPSNYYQFRRIVYSGPDSVCSDISDTVHLRDFPHITNYSLLPGANPTICAGTAPGLIIGNTPNNGNGLFTWQDSTNSATLWRNISGFISVPDGDYQPPVLISTTKYRRISHSYGCTATSDPVEIAVLQAITNNDISLRSSAQDTTICTGPALLYLTGTTNPSGGAGGPYTFQWLYSTSSTVLTEIAGATQPSYIPASLALNVPTSYRRQVIDRQSICRDTSSSVIAVNVLPPIANNTITTGQPAVCENALPEQVAGAPPTGGDPSGSYIYFWEQSTDGGLNWVPAAGANNLPNYQPPVLTNPIKYRRTVTSGLADCCTGTSPELAISINPAPLGPVYAGEDESIMSIDNSYQISADPPVVSGETGFWTVLQPGTAVVASESESTTEVNNLSATFPNQFLWTITNGLCFISDSVNIDLLPFVIPEGFSPNGDQWNNKFIIDGLNLSDQQIAELSILNGAGTVVFSTTNRDGKEWVDWDGRNNKGLELPEGTYYYLLKYTSNGKGVFRKSGFVELKRY